jgi:integrase
VRGLEWVDVDLVGRSLTVRQTIYFGEKDTPKSGHQRTVPLTVRLTDILREAATKPHQRGDPVAPSSRGKPWAEPSLRLALRRTLDVLKLPHARLHDLKHFFVTQCFRAGVGAPTVRELAGHRHMQVTARCAHSHEDAKRAAIDALDRRRAS